MTFLWYNNYYYIEMYQQEPIVQWLGHLTFYQATRVRIPLGSPLQVLSSSVGRAAHC